MPLAELRVLCGTSSIKPSIAIALREKFAGSRLILRFARAEFGSRVEIAADRRYSDLSTCWSLSTTSDSLEENIPGLRPIAIVAAIGFGGLLVSLISRATFNRPIYGLSAANAEGNAFGIAAQLFTRYVFAFEVVSALLITAAIGAMAEKEELFGKGLILTVIPESIVIFGLVVSILILGLAATH